jgi:hypothetical protein
MIVYRVQDYSGAGPWIPSHARKHVAFIHAQVCRQGKTRHPSEGPSPWESIPAFIAFEEFYDRVRLSRDLKDKFYEPWKFGCLSEDQLLDWFTPPMLFALHDHGYRLFELWVHESYILPGRTQCAFLPCMATRKAVRKLTELTQ